ncbi:putative leucine-rich PPR motif-containing protein [Apostichopus japonicus]|uniref:Putative leucine-rich PPR motif-containing protein n=1 Tax=Stichopus japonicus TaxID=307972 RepID=A0A2G8K808_STIJA|nr:putative leucine-rich PPR motif-containing protein [Apostichopus japonicus]
MSSVARASAIIRHLPVVYRQLSSAGCLPHHGAATTTQYARTLLNAQGLTCTPQHRHFHAYGAAYQNVSSEHRVGQSNFQTRNVETDFRVVLKRLDDMVRRTGRITRNQLQVVFDEVCKLGIATPNQSLLLIRSCGSLLPEVQPKERTELVHSFWDTLKGFGTKYDASHYNALLKVYLQNEHDFKPTEFLANMEQDNVEPNRVTYQRLISAYCLKGDIPGATQILEFMKSKDLPVTEGVFNSLITGHARSNDMENARNILNVMRAVGLEPSADTFTTLMAAYAESGAAEEIEKIMEEAESQNVTLSTRHILSVAYSLAVCGNTDQLPKILAKADIGSGFIPDTINLCLSLMARGLDEAAFEAVKLFNSIREDRNLVDGETFNQGNFFVDHAVINHMPFEKLNGYMDQMVEMGLHSNPHTVALQASLRRGDEEYAEKVIRRMKELGQTLRCHYFWPLLANVSAKNKTRMKHLLGFMFEMGVPVNIDTYTMYVLPVLKPSVEEMLKTVEELNGVVDKDLVNALCRNEVKTGRLSGVQTLMERYPDLVDVSSFKATLVSSFTRSTEVEPFITILKHASEKFESNSTENGISLPEYLGIILYDTISSIPVADIAGMKPNLQLLFSRMAQEKLYINGLRFRGIRNILDRNRTVGLKQYALKIVDPKEVEEKTVENLDLFAKEDVDVTELDKLCSDLKEKNANYRSPLRALLLHHCSANNYDKVMELKKEFDVAGYDLTGAMYAAMIPMCCKVNKVSEALLIKKQLKEFDPSFLLDITKYRYLIAELARSNQTEDIIPLIEEIAELNVDPDRLEKNMFHLMNDLAKEGLTEQVQLIFDNLASKDIIKVSSNLIGPLITSYIVRDDMTGALQCITDCQTKFKMMPLFHDLLVRLVEKGNTEQLQKAMDFTSEQHGDINMLYDLIFAFLTAGKLAEAQKVIETPGMVARDRRLQWYAEKCVSTQQLEPLQNLVNITRDLYNCDRDNMYFFLIQYHARARDAQKCLQVWTDMQEEGIIAKDRTMRYLANVLKTSNLPVPFQVPELPPRDETTDKAFSGESREAKSPAAVAHCGEHPVIVLSKAGNFVEAERQLESSQEAGEEVPLGVYMNLMWEHLKRGNIEECMQYKEQCQRFKDFIVSKDFYNRLVIEYVKKDDLENAHRVFCETLASGILPLASGTKLLAGKYQQMGNVEKMLEIKEVYESNTKSLFPATKLVLATFIGKNDITGAVSFIEGEIAKHPDRSRRMGLRSFYSKLVQTNQMTDEAVSFAEDQLSKDIDGPILGIVFAYLDNDKVEDAKMLIEKVPVLKEKSSALLGYIIDMVGKDDQVVHRIENVLSLTEGQSYLDREKVYFYLLKAFDLQDDWKGGMKVKERMEAEGFEVTKFNLKRLSMLLQRQDQQVPFEIPPESLAFYRDQLISDQKDHLQEIGTE